MCVCVSVCVCVCVCVCECVHVCVLCVHVSVNVLYNVCARMWHLYVHVRAWIMDMYVVTCIFGQTIYFKLCSLQWHK